MWRILRTVAKPATVYQRCAPLRHGTRFIYTRCIDPSIREFASTITSKQPVFQLHPSTVRVLEEPHQFYATILDMINQAERRIFISSLYIGSEEGGLISALKCRLKDKPDLELHILLDLNRSTRPGRKSTAKILLPLLQEFPTRVKVSMFRSPSLRGLLARLVPPRFNEGWGTWHAKIYGADDDVMISGANLNKSYFTNRQDRYLYFVSHKDLARYCFEFIQTVATFSYKLLPASSAPTSHLPSPNPHTYTHEDYTLHWPNPDTHPHYINAIAESELSQFQKRHREQLAQSLKETASPPIENAFLVPIIQAGQFNIREEEMTFELLFRLLGRTSIKHRPLLDLTSGYFSLYTPYQNFILNATNLDCRIVASSPKANGFFGSKGVSGRIPEGYTLYEQRFMSAVSKAGRLWSGSSTDGQGVLLNEWEKPGWTYHAKGIWLSPSPSTPPVLTLFGSTNLNSRSAHIDTELSFLIVIPSEGEPSSTESSVSGTSPLLSLRQDLFREIQRIRANSGEWNGGNRKVRWTTKIIVWLVKGML